MRKLRAPKYKLWDAVDSTTNPTSEETGVKQLDVVIYELEIDPTVNGTLKVEGSIDQENTEPKTWSELDFGTVITLNGGSSLKDQVIVRDNPFTFLRLKFQNSTGTGNITAHIAGVSSGA
jgi:hypothetical protein